MVFSAEASCWPDKNLAEHFPEVDTPYRFLNSGSYIGRAGSLLELFKDSILDEDDDQFYCAKKYLSGKYDIYLDKGHYIFGTREYEIKINNRSRSAKLRVAERL